MLLTATTRGRGRHRGLVISQAPPPLPLRIQVTVAALTLHLPVLLAQVRHRPTSTPPTPPPSLRPMGVPGGLGPSGSLTSDVNHGGFLLRPGIGWLLLTLICSGIGFDATVVTMAVQKWIRDSADVDAEAYLLVRV
ncbi:unnamed protein product [Musa hybrid cultivar]